MFTAGNPTKHRLYIPTLNDDPKDFACLFKLWAEVRRCQSPVIVFDFSHCRFLRPNAVAFLGGLARLAAEQDSIPVFDWNTMLDKVFGNLDQNGFTTAFGRGSGGWQGNSVPFREDPSRDIDNFVTYLENCWIGRDWVNVNPDMRDEIINAVAELYDNAFTHSASPIGVFTCGQRFPELNLLKLTLIDFGVGIPANVRDFCGLDALQAHWTMKWAFEIGHSTRQERIAGGLGLDTLKTFVKEKQGRIEIFSHEGYAIIDPNQEDYRNIATFFQGTLINITVKCDPISYTLF
jgi:signal transduction histidine kinase